MPIRNLMEYDCPENIKGEKGLIELLRDVKKGLSKVDFLFSDKSLKGILEIVEKGVHIFPSVKIDTKIDLSSAKKFIENYKTNLESGCLSCEELGKVNFKLGERGVYCNSFEDKSTVDEKKGHSPYTQKYFSKKGGCANKTPIFRPINEVLEEVE